jgi:hypothetical protein
VLSCFLVVEQIFLSCLFSPKPPCCVFKCFVFLVVEQIIYHVFLVLQPLCCVVVFFSRGASVVAKVWVDGEFSSRPRPSAKRRVETVVWR